MKIRMAIGTAPGSGNGGGALVSAVHDGVNGYWWVIPRGTILMFR